MSAADAREIGDLRTHPVEIGELVAYVTRHQLARSVEPHALRQPLEEGRAEFVLDVLDLPRQGRRREIEPLRRTSYRSGSGDFGDGGEGT